MNAKRLLTPVVIAVVLIIGVVICGVLADISRATPIGDAHRTINARYDLGPTGFSRARFIVCQKQSRTVVDCTLLLSEPFDGCSRRPPGYPKLGDLIPDCERPSPDLTERVRLRVHRGNVFRVDGQGL